MSLVVYNTLTNKKEKFVPIEAGKVKLYLCGPTVYDLLHIGNFRGPITFNLMRNWSIVENVLNYYEGKVITHKIIVNSGTTFYTSLKY